METINICQEFGTIGPLSVVQCLRSENVAWQADPLCPINTNVKHNLVDAFYLSTNAVWKKTVKERGLET